MGAWLTTLRTEFVTSNSNLRVVHLRLGAFNGINATCPSKKLALVRGSDFKAQSNEAIPQQSSDRPYERSQASLQIPLHKGSPVIELHNGVFDAIVGITARHGGTLYLGQGSLVYAMIGCLCPNTLVGWMMRGERGRDRRSETQADGLDHMGTEGWTQSSTEGECVNIYPS